MTAWFYKKGGDEGEGPQGGQPPVDKPSLVRVLLALSQLALEMPQIRELDINPLMARGDGCLAVDCRVVMG